MIARILLTGRDIVAWKQRRIEFILAGDLSVSSHTFQETPYLKIFVSRKASLTNKRP
jgi:hypothetical protein